MKRKLRQVALASSSRLHSCDVRHMGAFANMPGNRGTGAAVDHSVSLSIHGGAERAVAGCRLASAGMDDSGGNDEVWSRPLCTGGAGHSRVAGWAARIESGVGHTAESD